MVERGWGITVVCVDGNSIGLNIFYYKRDWISQLAIHASLIDNWCADEWKNNYCLIGSQSPISFVWLWCRPL